MRASICPRCHQPLRHLSGLAVVAAELAKEAVGARDALGNANGLGGIPSRVPSYLADSAQRLPFLARWLACLSGRCDGERRALP